MMNNLFSIFDPSSSYLSSCWIVMILMIVFISNSSWLHSTSFSKLTEKMVSFLFKEVSFTMGKPKKSEVLFIISLFLAVIFMNGIALSPQVFSISSHLVITLPLALMSWLMVNLFGWLKNTNHMLAHLVPQGTPVALMSFMVMIELTSSIIRPITLCVRLTANMIAGHLLMTLLGNALISLSSSLAIFVLVAPMVLTVLESAVAFIQSYVFMTLITLYTTEVK